MLPEDIDPELAQRFERNLEAMDTLITDALRFAQGTRETAEPVALFAYVSASAGNLRSAD